MLHSEPHGPATALAVPFPLDAPTGDPEQLKNSLFDHEALKNRLRSSGVTGLLIDCQRLRDDPEAFQLERCIADAAAVLSRWPEQLPQQLFARLADRGGRATRALLHSVVRSLDPDTWLPLTPSLARKPAAAPDRNGHSNWVSHIAFTGDGRAVSASWDGTLRVWNLDTGANLHILSGHTDRVVHVAVTAGGHAVSASWDKTLRVWDLDSGVQVRALKGHRGRVTQVALTADGCVVSAGWEPDIRVWQLETGTPIRVLKGHTDKVLHLALTGDGRALSASGNGSLRVWSLNSGATLRILEGHTDKVTHVTLAGTAKAVSLSLDGTLRVWDLDKKGEPLVLKGHTGSVTRVALTRDGRAVSVSDDQTLRVWNLATGAEIQVLEGGDSWHGGDILIDDRLVISSSSDKLIASPNNSLRVRSLDGNQDRVLLSGSAPILSAFWDPASRTIVAGDYEGTLHFLVPATDPRLLRSLG
jgi:WD40 repeat protein